MKKKKTNRTTQDKTTPSRTSSLEIPLAKLRWKCSPEDLGIGSMEEAEHVTEIIGQDRALRALRVGLEMQHHGYNIFVTGDSGTGRTTTIKRLLEEFETRRVDLTDKCYVHNFHDPDSPLMIALPAGQGASFRKDIAGLLTELVKGIPAVFESRRYQEQRKATLEHFQERQRSVLKDLERKVKEKGFEVVQVQQGPGMRPEIAPVIEGSPISIDQLQSKVDEGVMTHGEMQRLIVQQGELERLMDIAMREMRNIERKAKKAADALNNKIVVPVVDEFLEDLKSKFSTPRVHEFLEAVRAHVLENLPRFHAKEDGQPSLLGIPLQREEDRFLEFQVNVVVDNGETKGMPVVIESNPRYKNLFGTIERVIDKNGMWRMDFTHIKAGSLLKADGGFLVVNAIDALIEPGVWTTLKRVMRNHCLEIQPPESGLFGASSALKPEPIDLNVKVIMIGDPYTHRLLYGLDDDFKKIFKIKADFDVEMPNAPNGIASYVAFIKTVCNEDQLTPFELSGVTEIVEYGARLAGEQDKLSTRFNVIADVIREASYWATKEGATLVTGVHVRKAIDERIERLKLVEEKIQEMIENGTILIDTDGAVVGQVNGLSVYESTGYSFGKPSRITAKTSMGRAGIINIEREVELSGPTHNKGVLILGGYLRDMYAHNKPLIMSASIAFEQSYAGVDGDSASSTEVYAILSSLSGVPLRQDLAVTGSVNQHGEIQPIGGVNQKIEGFFDVCKARGLTGMQGVLIPHQNVRNLMLRHDVVDEVRNKKFHIYAIKHIDEGIELLTGKGAGTRKSGRFTPNSIHALVDARLTDYATRFKKFGG